MFEISELIKSMEGLIQRLYLKEKKWELLYMKNYGITTC